MNSQKNLKVYVLIDLDKYRVLEDKSKQLQTLGEKHLQLLNSEPNLSVKSNKRQNGLKRRKNTADQADLDCSGEEAKEDEMNPLQKDSDLSKSGDSTLNASKNREFIESQVFDRENELPDNWWKILDD